MKIGILTQPLHNNYGGVLQTYALQTVLKRMGHDPVNLKRLFYQNTKGFPYRYFLQVLSFVKCIFRIYLLHDDSRVLTNPFKKNYNPRKCTQPISKNTLSAFVSKHIAETSPLFTSEQLLRSLKKYSIDALVVGSDQVWREDYSPCISDYFLHFLPSVNNLKKIAYAASFGTENLNVSRKNLPACKDGIKQFQAISVRENSGINILAKQFGREAKLVLDPTLLLSASDYNKLIAEEKSYNTPNYVVSFILDDTSYKDTIFHSVLQHFPLSKTVRLKMHPLYETNGCEVPTMGHWLQSIRDAEFVVTDSFHGCVFSIIFRKPFIAIGNEFRGLDRFRTLLDNFGLTNRLVLSLDDFKRNESTLMYPIEYNEVCKKHEKMRSMSIEWLRKQLN